MAPGDDEAHRGHDQGEGGLQETLPVAGGGEVRQGAKRPRPHAGGVAADLHLGRAARREGSRSTGSPVQSPGSRYRSQDDGRHARKGAGQSALSRCAARSSSAAGREHGQSAATGRRSCGAAVAGAVRRSGQSQALPREYRPDAGRPPAGLYRSIEGHAPVVGGVRLTPPWPEVIAGDPAKELPGHTPPRLAGSRPHLGGHRTVCSGRPATVQNGVRANLYMVMTTLPRACPCSR